MFRFTIFIIAISYFSLFQPALLGAESPPNQLTLEIAKRIISERGAQMAVETSLDDKWDLLLDAIATGNPAWLDIAKELGRFSDAESSETLNAAMGEALTKSPREVLYRLDGKPFGVEGVCGNCFAEMGIQGATDLSASIAKQEIAVEKVKDKSLRKRRDYCLELIRKQKQH